MCVSDIIVFILMGASGILTGIHRRGGCTWLVDMVKTLCALYHGSFLEILSQRTFCTSQYSFL